MRKKLLALLLAFILLMLTACGAKNDNEEASEPAEIIVEVDVDDNGGSDAEDDGQNPVMNFVGLYQADRASMKVEAEGTDGAKLQVHWGSSAWESTEWAMSGKLDPQTLTVTYDNCVRTDRVYSQDGSEYTDTVVYEDGTGRVIFNPQDNSLIWEDDKENAADGMVFGFVPAGEPTGETVDDADYYSGVTALSKDKVESFAAEARKAYLDGDWATLAGMIRYPITIDKKELKDANAFTSFMETAKVAEGDRKALEAETCRDMFFNGQGLMLGDGQIWINDLNYMTDDAPLLKIIALNGIQGKTEPTPAADTKLPKVTKHPTDETVAAGDSCWFVAKYENAIWAEWHFVSPDGKTDLNYEKITTQFPDLVVVEGYASTTRLKNIPKEMDGWKVYCRFSNNNGSVNTDMATIRIKEDAVPDTSVPKVTKSPTSETVEPGGSCWFVAKHEKAILAEWFFVTPDSASELSYKDIGSRFPELKVVDGNTGSMLLKNIPAEMDGWMVYCRFTNDNGSADTARATINIKNASTDRYLGTYVCGRASIHISGGPELYTVLITWGSSASEHSEWTFTGKFDENGVLTYTDCTRTDLVYTDDVTHTDTVVYSNGTGKLEYKDFKLSWTDDMENKGEGMTFTKDYLA